MTSKVSIELLPLGKKIEVEKGAAIKDLLFPYDVEFPCGGLGRCKGCRVRVLKGKALIGPDDEALLSSESLKQGWRLACCMRAHDSLQLEIAQWESNILGDDRSFTFTPEEGLGVAVDIGTTTVVAQLLDLTTGKVLAVRSALNLQAKHGSDIMSRIHAAIHQGMESELTNIIRKQVGHLVSQLMDSFSSSSKKSCAKLSRVVLVGNTVMHHLFCGIPIEVLAEHPFETTKGNQRTFKTGGLGWDQLDTESKVHFLPCMGSFVGSDLLAGAIAQNIHLSKEPCLLVDLGTNGEILIGNRERMLCASTAAGPAFEGAKISMGMRASSGAISKINGHEGTLECHVLGGGEARGLCGSGLVDAVAVCLDQKRILPNGRVPGNKEIPLSGMVNLNPLDIRELQLAKGAIAAGIQVLSREWEIPDLSFQKVFLAGAFGNYINLSSAQRIGLLHSPIDRILPAGNTALLGAKRALFDIQSTLNTCEHILKNTRHVSLNESPEFMDLFVENMGFPENPVISLTTVTP